MNAGSTITGTLILGALVLKASDFVKYLLALTKSDSASREDGKNGVLSLVITAALGVLLVWAVAQTQWADEIPIGGETLGRLGGPSLIVLGLVISSFGSTLYDLKKAIDRSDSASTPRVGQTAETQRLEGLRAYFGEPEASVRPGSTR